MKKVLDSYLKLTKKTLTHSINVCWIDRILASCNKMDQQTLSQRQKQESTLVFVLLVSFNRSYYPHLPLCAFFAKFVSNTISSFNPYLTSQLYFFSYCAYPPKIWQSSSIPTNTTAHCRYRQNHGKINNFLVIIQS